MGFRRPDHIYLQKKSRKPLSFRYLSVGVLRNYCNNSRRTAEIRELLGSARSSKRSPDSRLLPQPNALHRSVVKLIVDDYQAGASTYELAERYKVRRNTIRDVLKRNHVPITGAKVKLLTDDDKEDIRKRRQDGSMVGELAVEYGVSESTIRRAGLSNAS
ncbi:hypothetical protein CLV54_1546 [Compostimonas suwonensis]|uniref:Uncharacterized protein n=1 Tax=Compostimonas suwonensis TaxID=1048394 RepID=A0A2M9C0I7_9MICO|nr:hypothetical protein CLV54_1546 [Compostimonas suwonensis]